MIRQTLIYVFLLLCCSLLIQGSSACKWTGPTMAFSIHGEPNGTFCDWVNDSFKLKKRVENKSVNWFASLEESNGSLTSSVQGPQQDSCLTFQYVFYSEYGSQLNVHLQYENREKSKKLLWSLPKVIPGHWDNGKAPIKSTGNYTVVFSASSSQQVWIDNIKISNCTFDSPKATPATTPPNKSNNLNIVTSSVTSKYSTATATIWIVVGAVTLFAVAVSIAIAVIVFRQRRRNRTTDQMVNRRELPTPKFDHKNEHKTQESNGSLGIPARGTVSASLRLSEQFERDDEGYEAPVSPRALNDYDRDPTFRRDHGPNVKDAAPQTSRQMLEPSGSNDSAVAVDPGNAQRSHGTGSDDGAQQSMRQEMETCSAATRRTGRYDCLAPPDAGTQSAQYGYTSLRGLAKHNLIVEEAADYITVVGEGQSTVQQGCDVEYSLAKRITGDNEKPSEEEANEYITLVDERDSQLYSTVTK